MEVLPVATGALPSGSLMRIILAIMAFALCLGLVRSASADTESCRNAIDQFNSARSDISCALRTYASCVSGSDGHDDCSGEFSTLQSANSDFESAVSEYETGCQ